MYSNVLFISGISKCSMSKIVRSTHIFQGYHLIQKQSLEIYQRSSKFLRYDCRYTQDIYTCTVYYFISINSLNMKANDLICFAKYNLKNWKKKTNIFLGVNSRSNIVTQNISLDQSENSLEKSNDLCIIPVLMHHI